MQTMNELAAPGRKRAGAVLITILGVLLLGSAAAKFAHVAPVVAQLAASGFAGSKLTFVALLEALSALLFLIPATRSAGLLLLSAFLGGAIATHLQHSDSIFVPSAVLVLAWLGAWLRNPEILWSWRAGTRQAKPQISSRNIAQGA
ncbi:MAG TPA: DoxX family protein [Terriglobales bacterium]|nr:DoxX family protein [Terriglobales bacterium]